jgi:hypothetical protein
MSRSLPPHPNLAHLKKQAKDLLNDLKQQNPASKLADAQHTLAREYGFASWPKLKVYVEELSGQVAAVGAQQKGNPFAGRWTANLAKSRRHPANPFQSATMEFTVLGDSVTIVDVVVDEAGREERSKNTILADEVEYPSGNGYTLMARWRGLHILETVAKKDGQVAGWGKYEVSDDGKTLTISADDQMIVLDHH